MSNPRILLVDDEENVLKSLLRIFKGIKYDIYTAFSGAEGIKMIKNRNFHLIISDYRMPEMNGVEFLKKARDISPDTIRIILTGNADIETAISAINEGNVYKFLLKPWDTETLKIDIKRSLEYYDLIMHRRALNVELKKKNEQLEDMNKNLEKLVEERTQQLIQSEKMAALGQMAGQIGHEIKNNLTVLSGNLQLMQMNKVDKKIYDRSMHLFENELERMKVHANNLLTLGKPKPSRFENLNIIDILKVSIDSMIETGIIKYYTIIKDFADNLPEIYGDESKICQVFTNLIINAHHAMNGKGKLTFTADVSKTGDYIETKIKDTGEGIAKENLQKIFEPFFTTKSEGKGSGLGLLVVKKIMDEHNGYIKVKSELNIGTDMSLGFPVNKQKIKLGEFKNE